MTELGAVVQRPSRHSGNASRVCRCVGLFFVLTLLFAWGGAAAADAKRVLLLHSFGQDFKPWSEYARSIRSELQRQSPWQLDITNASLVTARSSNEDPEVPFVAYLSALFAKQQPDLIVSVGAPAAAFVQRHRPQLFADTPMVLTAVDERRVQFTALSESDVVVAVRIDYLAAFENILHVLPDTKNVMVVVGTSPIEQFWTKEIGNAVKPIADRVSFTWTNNLSFDDVVKKAAALPPHSAIFWELMIVDAAGVVHEGDAALARLHAVSRAPIFSYDESFFEGQIVGGPLLAVLDSSRQTAAVAIRILAGEKPNDIKIPSVKFSPPKFDWRELQRWGISESRLPLGSEVLFREPTTWERYRWQLIAIFAALSIQAAMITWLVLENRRRRNAEQESRRRLLQVMHLSRTAEAGAMSASIAHELNQPLGSIMLNTDMAERLLEANPPEVGRVKGLLADIRQADQLAAGIIQHLGRLLKRRSQIELQEFDLTDAIADALHVISPEAAMRNVTLRADGAQQPLPVRADRVHLQQVVIILVTNAMDAQADTGPDACGITVQTALVGEAEVQVSVSDSGAGIPEHALSRVFDTFYTTKKQGTGLGLSIARTIVETYGGKIWAENKAGGGAVFRFTLPLLRPA